jgi:hypothetical protein
VIRHAGGLLGCTSIVCLIPEKNDGFAIEFDAEGIAPRCGLMYELLDHATPVSPTVDFSFDLGDLLFTPIPEEPPCRSPACSLCPSSRW